ncbi:DMT family transporter [Piscinibacter sakaiensis]|uniref:Permease of the drug/metabolite transporter DMT superfamily n=1 Tax=Piscinibacter sakaiensis TaxID=1547922 RepID=A0A0K8P3L7_PISS1|nr:DMT family transporter [Piscinibacter sakaiensis]GAP36825.1 permease of the drug/metabolite transporter DMT superfamily [Piscinibacter sakaiensis]
MRRADLLDLVLLAALWGGSFLFTRIAAPAFGPLPVAGLRVAGAALVLLPLLAWRGETAALGRHWRPLLLVGLSTSALPFALYAYAALRLNAGLASIFNAATPLFAALIAWAWLGDRPSRPRVLGLVIGFLGVFGLAWSKAGLAVDGEPGLALAVAACIVATLSYGYAATATKRFLSGAPSLAVAAGSQLAATLLLAGPAALTWPARSPGPLAWFAVAALAFASTGLAYLLYFRLIARVGPARAVTVTFLVPAFAVAWGALFLGETLTLPMVAGCGVILFGTALAVGLVGGPRPARTGRG